ncbi:hypothetical protein Pelo_11298 [Pelomyxa schiedti]|nr:hypothetical protein Pelo_11298 [Pelomyxa schiedti]
MANNNSKKNRKVIDLYVVHVGGCGERGGLNNGATYQRCAMSRPCYGCVRWLSAYGVKRVFYSVDIGTDTQHTLYHNGGTVSLSWHMEKTSTLRQMVTYKTAIQRDLGITLSPKKTPKHHN